MTENEERDRWKIRFGQIFQALLAKSGKKLEDYLYFLPLGFQWDPNSGISFELIDLNRNRDLYNRYFSSQVLVVPKLSKEIAVRLEASLVIVPGFGHHLFRTRAFEEQIDFLKGLGFEVVYARYADSFDSTKNCAKRVYDIVNSEVEDQRKMIFLTVTPGCPVMVKLLSDPRFEDVAARTRAVVNFGRAFRGSPQTALPKTRLALRLLKLYRELSHGIGYSTKIKRKLLNWLSRLPFHGLKKWHALVEKAFELEEDLKDLPVDIVDLARVKTENDNADTQWPKSFKLFSIPALYPKSEFKEGLRSITNADDLFLYVSDGVPNWGHGVKDTQVLLPGSVLPGPGDIIDLGIVKADHWGIAMPRVLSKNYTDPFPRTEMLSAVLLTLDEYLEESPSS